MSDRVKSLARSVPSVSPDTLCSDVYDLFCADEDLLAVAVCQDGRPIGMVNRNDLTQKLADRFGRPLFERKPITRLMDASPLIVEADVSIEFLNQLIVDERPGALMDGFIIIESGDYLGMGSALSLLQANMFRAKKRSEELDRARIEAETANRTKSMFLANMSHELRTPLNAIIGFTDFICTETLGPIQPKEYGDYIRDVNESGRHLLNVINALLDMSKIEAGRLELREDYVDGVETMRAVARMMRATAERRGLEVSVQAPDDLPDLFADEQLLRQILLNLLSNALKHSDPGAAVTMTAEITADGTMVFRVIDAGCGIAEQDLDRVMERFAQADVSLSRRSEGSGLGLPLVKALAEAHGGTFSLESQLDVGTTAIVRFPAHRVTCGPEGQAKLHSVA